MVTSDRLLQLVQELQRDVTVRQGRRTLLNYASSSTGAHLALLFAFDKVGQTLILLERSGRRLPQHSPLSRNQHASSQEQLRRISSLGLFGSVLQQRGLLYISSASAYSRSLEEERYWIGQDESIILSAIGEEQGVLVLCMGSKHKTQHKDAAHTQVNEGNLLVCTTLLSAYLFTTDEKVETLGGGLSPVGLPPRISASPVPTETKSYEEQLHTALDQERRHIAHDLHDGVAQQLAHVIHKLEFIQLIMAKQPDVALREIAHASDILKASLKELRQGISSLLPAQLGEQGFEIALQGLLDEYTRSQPMLKLEYDADDLALVPLALGAPLFRFIQEALNNVGKHAQASRVCVRIRILSGLLVAEVSDNGRGFDVEQALAKAYASGSASN